MFFMIFPILCPTQRKQFRMFHSWQWYDKKTVELSRRPSCKLVYFTGKKSLELLPFEVRVLPPKLNKQWAKYFSGLEEFIWWQIFHVAGERERERDSSPSGVVSTSQTWDKWWQSFTNIGIVSWTQHWELQLPAMLVDIKPCWSSSARTVWVVRPEWGWQLQAAPITGGVILPYMVTPGSSDWPTNINQTSRAVTFR